MADRFSDSICTYASSLQSESEKLPKDYQTSKITSLSYLEACLVGCTDFVDVVPYVNTLNESTPWNYRMKPTAILDIIGMCDSAEEQRVGWFTNGLETGVHLQVRSGFLPHVTMTTSSDVSLGRK
jgi:hypothetical protein